MSNLDIVLISVGSSLGYLFMVGVTYALSPAEGGEYGEPWRWMAALMGPLLLVPYAGNSLVNWFKRKRSALPVARVVSSDD